MPEAPSQGTAIAPVIRLCIPGEAVPWARARLGQTMVHFTPERQRGFMATVQAYAAEAMAGALPFDGPLDLLVVATYVRPPSHSKKRRTMLGAEWKTSKPDADNISKIIKDAFNKLVWFDDAQVARLHVEKKYGDVSQVTIEVRSIGESDGKHARRDEKPKRKSACPADDDADEIPL